MAGVLVEALTAVAAAGGAAVVQAAGTDAWYGVRDRVAALLGRGDEQLEQAALERLDRTARALEADRGVDPGQELSRQEGMWQERFETLLAALHGADQERAARDLRALPAFVAEAAGDVALATGDAVARDGGSAVTGVRRTGGGQAARAVRTGNAEATGAGSTAVSGVVTE
ncbi:hypothetical protein [Streptomyces sp.]|uniref:hypothetical protein n=1 Tax=Streptomyces sp. TaxID=1931 RepID=UPI0028111EE3|nr:hypothetical protein [Streptomyces sp.]